MTAKLTDKRLSSVREWLNYEGSVVYFVGPRRGELVKIGFAASLPERLRHLQTGSPVKLEVLAAVAGGLAEERVYHQRFAAFRQHGEWFFRSPEIKEEMGRLQELGPPSPSAMEMAERAANIKSYFRAEMKRRRERS